MDTNPKESFTDWTRLASRVAPEIHSIIGRDDAPSPAAAHINGTLMSDQDCWRMHVGMVPGSPASMAALAARDVRALAAGLTGPIGAATSSSSGLLWTANVWPSMSLLNCARWRTSSNDWRRRCMGPGLEASPTMVPLNPYRASS